MTQDLLLANATLVLGDETLRGQVLVRDGAIHDITTGTTVPRGAVDCDGDFLAPGLIELHTDNLERHIAPRPGVDWPHQAAIVAHDAELASTGITTVFDAIRVGSVLSNPSAGYGKYARGIADEILAIRETGILKIRHHLHLRAEICSETLIEELDEFGPSDRVGIVSLMDHTPGQRQYRDVSKFAAYVLGKNGMTQAKFEEYVRYLEGLQQRLGARHEAAAVAAASRFGATLASHDDTTAAQVATSKVHGVRVAEFPTTQEAAEACRAAGIAVIMGGPNLVRGGSHSGNIAAKSLAEQGLVDILSSDYVPASLLMGGVILGAIWGNMARGIATVTATPADRVGLTDRGRLAPGLRADLIRFRTSGTTPALRGVWCDGRQVA
ncbi:alpha-D-ribose 1-methylphosphonate 5-triphosphate diphosphatase [Pseudoruegeria sp. SK021]|uniref:alpha-D-ribose 1-methylphosphonate 5-triphosphate diphosphatase n=1 Tax=Pseudoruegeria sp. SK021 TaxID=1933035 RepID=UPI000A24E3DD|nr:alpha-D-ribose 1-methylphosphonate 5-triphosphate diphosphatase [Pseudoruegeria sp. SK021]OSP56028.1 phosphonate metabolism protein PhnM [Pseudoruegeria sp. SK021]